MARHTGKGVFAATALAKVMSGKLGELKLAIGKPRYNPHTNTLYLPGIPGDDVPEDALTLLRAYLAHEAAERGQSTWDPRDPRWFDADPAKRKPGLKTLVNAINDARIDLAYEKTYPGAYLNIRWAVQRDFDNLKERNRNEPVKPSVNLVATLCRYLGEGITTLDDLYAEFPQLTKHLAKVDGMLRALDVSDEGRIIDQAIAIYEALKKPDPVEPEVEKPEQPESLGQTETGKNRKNEQEPEDGREPDAASPSPEGDQPGDQSSDAGGEDEGDQAGDEAEGEAASEGEADSAQSDEPGGDSEGQGDGTNEGAGQDGDGEGATPGGAPEGDAETEDEEGNGETPDEALPGEEGGRPELEGDGSEEGEFAGDGDGDTDDDATGEDDDFDADSDETGGRGGSQDGGDADSDDAADEGGEGDAEGDEPDWDDEDGLDEFDPHAGDEPDDEPGDPADGAADGETDGDGGAGGGTEASPGGEEANEGAGSEEGSGSGTGDTPPGPPPIEDEGEDDHDTTQAMLDDLVEQMFGKQESEGYSEDDAGQYGEPTTYTYDPTYDTVTVVGHRGTAYPLPVSEYGAAAQTLETRLRQALTMPAPRMLRRREKGEVDERSLHRLVLGQTDVFRRRVITEADDVAVTVSWDESGSMGSGSWTGKPTAIQTVQRLAYTFNAALGRLNIPTELLGWTTGSEVHNPNVYRQSATAHRVYKEFKDRATDDKVLKRLSRIQVSGFTPTAEGLRFALERLAARHERRKVLFFLTDGQPYIRSNGTDEIHTDFIRTLVHRAERAGIEVVGVGIGAELGHLFPRWVQVNDVSELRGRVADELLKVLKEGKRAALTKGA